MAERRVTQTGKDADGDITKLCNPSSDWSQVSATQAISDIEAKRHSYHVNETGHRTEIHVVNDGSKKYLRTTADRSDGNNLDNLPDC